MLVYIEDKDRMYEYLANQYDDFGLGDIPDDLLRCVTLLRTCHDMQVGHVDRYSLVLSLVLEEDISPVDRADLENLLGSCTLQVICVNQFCYMTTCVGHNKYICLQEVVQAYRQISNYLSDTLIRHRVSLEVTWNGAQDLLVTSNFFPHVQRCDWHQDECYYYVVSYEAFLKSLTAAMISMHATVYYDTDVECADVLMHLHRQGIYADSRSMSQKVKNTPSLLNTTQGGYVNEITI